MNVPSNVTAVEDKKKNDVALPPPPSPSPSPSPSPPAKAEVQRVNSKVTLKTKGRMTGLKVRKVRSKLMLSVPSSPDASER